MEKTGKKKQMADMTNKVGPAAARPALRHKRNEAAAAVAAVSRHKVATSNAAVAVSLPCVRLIFP